MGCQITSGIAIDCNSLKRVGGLNKELWLFNISDLRVPIAALTSGFVTSIPLLVYRTLYKIEGNKYSHSFEINEQRSEEGNVQWEHKLMIKVVNTTPGEDQVLEDLATGEFGAVVRTNNNDFFILGAQNGLTSTEAQLLSGKNSGDSSATSVTLTGNEATVYKRLLNGDVNNTVAMLNAMTSLSQA